MAKGSTYDGDLLRLLLNATGIPHIADNTASAATPPLTSLSVALHTADPGASGTQSTNEVAYAAYLRVLTTRTTLGWVVSASDPATASPVAAITFAQVTSAGSSTTVVTHFSLGIGVTTAGSSGKIFYKGTVTPNITLGQNVTPSLTTGSSITED